MVYHSSSPNPTFNVSPALETSPNAPTKWNGCRCGSRVHHIICWIQTLTLTSTSAYSLLQWLLVTPGFKGVTDSLTMSFPFWCCLPQIPLLSCPISVFTIFQSHAAHTSSRRKSPQRAPCPLPILCSSTSTKSSHDPNLSVLPDLTYDPNTHFSLSAIVFPFPDTNPNQNSDPSHKDGSCIQPALNPGGSAWMLFLGRNYTEIQSPMSWGQG